VDSWAAGGYTVAVMPVLTLYCDGAARGNPLGPAGCGAVLYDEARVEIAALKKYLGRATNNEAEYEGLLLGLEHAITLAASRISIRADSELLVKQVRGEYRVKARNLVPLHARAIEMVSRIGTWDAEHVPRKQNARADELANEAIDRALSTREP
jgi:ribonuclease HI